MARYMTVRPVHACTHRSYCEEQLLSHLERGSLSRAVRPEMESSPRVTVASTSGRAIRSLRNLMVAVKTEVVKVSQDEGGNGE